MARLRFAAILAVALAWASASAAPLAFVANKSGSFPGSGGNAYITAVASARLTRAGIDDIVVTRGIFPPDPEAKIPMRLLAPQSDGSVADITTAAIGPNPPGMVHPRHIVFGDFNRDGRLDVFVAAHGYDQAPFNGETNVLLLSTPAGSYSDASALLPAAPDFSHSAAVGDINGDGNPDVCVINIYSPLFIGPYCLLGNGGTAFPKGGQLPSYVTSLAKKYTTSLMLDVDNDGLAELILGCDANGPTSIILFNDGTGDFTKLPSKDLPTGLFGTTTINLSIASIDINADGFPDLLMSQTSLNYVGHAIQVLVNDGHGTYSDQTLQYLPSAMDPNGPWFEFVRVLDLNGDGIPDIYAQGVSGPVSGNVLFAWVSDAPGHYVPVDSSVIGGSNPFMVVFADQDGDGLPDLISLSNGPSGQINYQTYRNVTPRPSGSSKAPDLNGDSRSDLIWRNDVSGESRAWVMNGLAASSTASLLTDLNWRITHAGDFNGDGRSDLLWYNPGSGQTAIWLMNGTTYLGGAIIFSSPQWKVSRVADFNGDGMADLLWRNSVTGETAIWLMTGTSPAASAVILVSQHWVVTHTGDFNGDGKADLVWRNVTTGETAIWLMNGASPIGSALILADARWAVSHVGDFNGDGKADLLWSNTSTGQTAAWLMNGTSPSASAVILNDPNWAVTHVADFNADGKTDLVWRNPSTRSTAMWLMNGLGAGPSAFLVVNSDWSVRRTGDHNGDGLADLVWRNGVTGETALWLMGGLTPISSVAPLFVPSFAVQ